VPCPNSTPPALCFFAVVAAVEDDVPVTDAFSAFPFVFDDP
jgi:hypothetical protein